MSELVRQNTPPELLKVSNNVIKNLSPEKSKDLYIKNYNKFRAWQVEKNTEFFSENVLLAYFNELKEKYSPNTLWSIYSQLKSTLSNNHNVHIEKYPRLISLMKKENIDYHPKKSKVLTSEQIEEFLNKAPDDQFLASKVALIFGILGAGRRKELSEILISHIKEYDSELLLVDLPTTKTHKARKFTITDQFYTIVNKYRLLKPSPCKTDRFSINYRAGKCTQQPIGINKLGDLPKQIAAYLKLENSNLYTGHSFRRTSTTLLADAGADIPTSKRHSGWKSGAVAEQYIADSVQNEIKICNKIGRNISVKDQNKPIASTSKEAEMSVESFDEVDLITATSEKKDILNSKSYEKPPSKTIKLSQVTTDNPLNSSSQNFMSQQNQNVHMSSKLEFPCKRFNLNISNCGNVNWYFSDK